MKQVTYDQIYSGQVGDAILHTHQPFIKDYLCLHILLRKYNPKSVFEIGTHIAEGTRIICNAVPEAKVYTLDLPDVYAYQSKQHPAHKGAKVGASFPKGNYEQINEDSLYFDYSLDPCDAYFIDGEHDWDHVYHETTEILKQSPKLIIWHDADMPEVNGAILDAFKDRNDYELIRITDTRIAYAISKAPTL